jgi:hypothetical protein
MFCAVRALLAKEDADQVVGLMLTQNLSPHTSTTGSIMPNIFGQYWISSAQPTAIFSCIFQVSFASR